MPVNYSPEVWPTHQHPFDTAKLQRFIILTRHIWGLTVLDYKGYQRVTPQQQPPRAGLWWIAAVLACAAASIVAIAMSAGAP